MINSGLERQIARNNLVNIEEHTDEYIIDRRGGGGEGGQPVPSISPHQLPVNHCNRRQLERAHQKAGVADTQRCSYIQLQINKKKPHSESHPNGACWHSRMPIITSRAHQSQVLFRCMPFDHHHCLHRARTFSHFAICIYITCDITASH